ncbi:MAG: hypothetical protein LWW79_09365 [Holophagaceae bacterium]|nr:hypothetical protein [Holophagaceae bacterium]
MAIQGISSATSTRMVVDPRDLNRDGKVTMNEVLAYNRAHQVQAPRAASDGASKPAQKQAGKGPGGLIDLYA